MDKITHIIQVNSTTFFSLLNLLPTDEGVEAVWFAVPVDPEEVDGYAGQHDGQTDTADHRLNPQREDEQEEGGKEEEEEKPS